MRNPLFILFGAFALLAASLPAGAAAAQTTEIRNHNTDQPIDIVADRLRVDQDAQVATFEGAVEAVQGELRFLTDTLKVYYEKAKGGGDPTIARLDASGGIRLESPSESAEGESAVYDVNQRIITLIGDVILRREDSELRGERLEFDLASGMTKFDGKIFNAHGIEVGSRVVGRFKVPDNPK